MVLRQSTAWSRTSIGYIRHLLERKDILPLQLEISSSLLATSDNLDIHITAGLAMGQQALEDVPPWQHLQIDHFVHWQLQLQNRIIVKLRYRQSDLLLRHMIPELKPALSVLTQLTKEHVDFPK